MRFTLTNELTDLTGAPITDLGTGKPATAAQALATIISNHSKPAADAKWLYKLAREIWETGILKIGRSDLQTILTMVETADMLTVQIRGQLLQILDPDKADTETD